MRRLLAVLTLFVAVPAAAQYGETIVVGRTLLTARIVDRSGKAILGLEPADLVAQIDGRPVEVKSVTWFPETGDAPLDPAFLDALAGHDWLEAPPQGRLFVFFFQTDFARNRLRFHLDFSGDRKAILRASRRSLGIGEPAWPPAPPGPSLGACLDREKMRRFTREEEALLHVAEALREVPGEKQILFVGTRLGAHAGGAHVMDRVWDEAKRQLLAADVRVNGFYAIGRPRRRHVRDLDPRGEAEGHRSERIADDHGDHQLARSSHETLVSLHGSPQRPPGCGKLRRWFGI